MNPIPVATAIPNCVQAARVARLKRAVVAGIAILMTKVLLAILWEYRWYFPPDFETSAFLGGRRHTFHGFYPYAFYAHIIAGPISLVLAGFLLFSRGLRRHMRWHRWAGRLQFALVILVLFPSGLMMSRFAYAGPPAMAGLGLLALLTAGATTMSAAAARRGNFRSHRRWAERSFLLLVSPLILRLGSGTMTVLNIESVATYRRNAWLSWLLPLAIYEVWRSRQTCTRLRRSIFEREGSSPAGTSLVIAGDTLSAKLHPTARRARRGFALRELVVVIILLIIGAALLLPNVRTAREAARRMQCSNNLRQLGRAILNYETAHSCLPSAMAGTDGNGDPLSGNANRLSGFVPLLPFLERQRVWDAVSSPLEVDGVQYPPMGPAPWIEAYPPWATQLPGLWCPSAFVADHAIPPTHYAFCVGDVCEQLHGPTAARGAFACRLFTKLADITDGISSTIALSELGNAQVRTVIGQVAIEQPVGLLKNPNLCLQTAAGATYLPHVPLSEMGRGARWTDGAAPHGLVATILPPNSPSCAVGGSQAVDGIYSGGSLHVGGQHVSMIDGSTHFISAEVDAGSATSPPPAVDQASFPHAPSPYGVWGALGTAAAQELD